MSVAAKLAAFAAGLGAIFVLALVAGGAIDPDPETEAAGGHAEETAVNSTQTTTSDDPRGLAVADDGLRLEIEDTGFEPGRRETLAFRIVGAGGEPVTDFEVEHERAMHVIVVRRDLTGYQHVHPRLNDEGTWEVDLALDEPGTYRVFADFNYEGESHTLGSDLTVAGEYHPEPLPAPADKVQVAGGYEVTAVEDGHDLRFSVSKDGRVLDDIEPYLGARGHLVALRDGDLAFLHVHPEDEATEGRDITFGVEYPSEGRYRLFLQFKHEGRVHTAEFTREAGEVEQQSTDGAEAGHGEEAGDEH